MIQSVSRLPMLTVLALWFGLLWASVPAAAQVSPLPAGGEPEAVEPAPALLELRKRQDDLRNRLSEWLAKAAEDIRTGQESGAP